MTSVSARDGLIDDLYAAARDVVRTRLKSVRIEYEEKIWEAIKQEIQSLEEQERSMLVNLDVCLSAGLSSTIRESELDGTGPDICDRLLSRIESYRAPCPTPEISPAAVPVDRRTRCQSATPESTTAGTGLGTPCNSDGAVPGTKQHYPARHPRKKHALSPFPSPVITQLTPIV